MPTYPRQGHQRRLRTSSLEGQLLGLSIVVLALCVAVKHYSPDIVLAGTHYFLLCSLFR